MKVTVSTKGTNSALSGETTPETTLNTTMDKAAVGPETRCIEDPNRPATMAMTMAP